MPINLRSADKSFGYAFVNITSAPVAAQLMRQLQLLAVDEKEWQVMWSSCQGRKANVERYRNSPLMHETVPADCKPALYDDRGVRVQFPAPTKHISKPRIHYSKDKLKVSENEVRAAIVKASIGPCSIKEDTKPQQNSRKNMHGRRGWPSM
jgi:hypothetical protein